jgi:hypothetical protein
LNSMSSFSIFFIIPSRFLIALIGPFDTVNVSFLKSLIIEGIEELAAAENGFSSFVSSIGFSSFIRLYFSSSCLEIKISSSESGFDISFGLGGSIKQA